MDNIERSTLKRKEFPFFQVDNNIFDIDLNLTIYQKITYIYLCRCSNNGADAFPSYNTIAKKCCMSRRKAIDTIKELIDINLLEKQVRKKGNNDNYSNLYVLNEPSACCALPSEYDAPTSEQCAPKKETIINNQGKKRREGVKSEDVNTTSVSSIPFYDYVNQLLKSYVDIERGYKQEIYNSILYYCSKYEEVFGVEHTRYKTTMLKTIIKKLYNLYKVGIWDGQNSIFVGDGLSFEDFKQMADKNFTVTFNGKGDKRMSYTLLSFLNDNVLIHRFYEELY